jgi:hypothetical protein
MRKTKMTRVKAMKMKKVRARRKIITKRRRPEHNNQILTRELRALGITQDNHEQSEEPRPTRSKMSRELRLQSTKPPAEESTTTTTSTNNEGSPGAIHSAITSDSGVPTTFEEPFLDQRAMFGDQPSIKNS